MSTDAVLKALSMTQPHAQLVVEGYKLFETRSWGTGYRGRIAIHASKGFPRSSQALLEDGDPIADTLNRAPGELQRGAIIGLVTIKDCLPVSVAFPRYSPDPIEQVFGDWSPGRYIWQLEDPLRLQRPIPVKGMLGLWAVPQDIAGQVLEQLAA